MNDLLPRDLYPRDVDVVDQIDRGSFQYALGAATLSSMIASKKIRSRAFQYGLPARGLFNFVVGFYFYRPCHDGVELLRFAVAPEYRRRGFGRRMFEFLLGRQDCDAVVRAYVRETNLEAQLFLRGMGMLCVEQHRGRHEPTGEDLYEFVIGSASPSYRPIPARSHS